MKAGLAARAALTASRCCAMLKLSGGGVTAAFISSLHMEDSLSRFAGEGRGEGAACTGTAADLRMQRSVS